MKKTTLILLLFLTPIVYGFTINTEGANKVEILDSENVYVKTNPGKEIEFDPASEEEHIIKLYYADGSVKEYVNNKNSNKKIVAEEKSPSSLFSAVENDPRFGPFCNKVIEEFKRSLFGNYSTRWDFNLDFKINLADAGFLARLVFEEGEEACEARLTEDPAIEDNPEVIEWAIEFENQTGIDVESVRDNNGSFAVVVVNEEVSANLQTETLEQLLGMRLIRMGQANLNSIIHPLGTDLFYLEDGNAEGLITLKKNGLVNRIVKCSTLLEGVCVDWELTDIVFEDNNTHISFYAESFSGYAGIELEILNVHSYPYVGKEWRVEFTTLGTANLTIEAVEGTTWALSEEDVDLVFEGVKCGENYINYTWNENKVFVKDYTCNNTSTEISRLITAGKHVLEFTFGNTSIKAFNRAWWDGNYSFRRILTINNTIGQTLVENYSINLTLDTASLISGGRLNSNCSDLRITWFNGTQELELDRINETACNSANTEIWFRLQDQISASSADSENYTLYYGHPSATSPPNNRSNIYKLFEDFEDQSHPFSDGTMTIAIDGVTVKNGNYSLDGEGAGGYRRAVVPESLSRGMIIEGWVYSDGDGGNADLPGLELGMTSGTERNGYQMVLDWRSLTGGSSDMQFREDYGSGSPLDTDTSNTVVKYAWYYLRFLWDESGNLDGEIYDSNMNPFGSLSASDATYTAGYYGLGAYKGGKWDDIKVRYYLSTEPSISLQEEQSDELLLVSLNNPSNSLITGDTEITFNCSATSGTNIKNITLYGNWSGSWQANETVNVSRHNLSIELTKTLLEGNYKWNCLAVDDDEVTATALINFTLLIDGTGPEITLNSPLGTSNNFAPLLNISLNEFGSVNYSLNSGNNISLCGACSEGQTRLYLEEKYYDIDVYAYDPYGNLNQGSFNYTVDLNNNFYDDYTNNYTVSSFVGPDYSAGNISISGILNYELVEDFEDGGYSDGNPVSWSLLNEGVGDDTPEWGVVTGIFTESGNCHDDSSNNGRDYIAKGCYAYLSDYKWKDYNFTTVLRASDDDGMGVMFNYIDNNNYYRARFELTREFRKLEKFVDGTRTELEADYLVDGGLTINSWWNLRVERAGSNINVYLNDSLIMSAVDSDLPYGSVSLYSWGMDNGLYGADFQEVNVSGSGDYYILGKQINLSEEISKISNISWTQLNNDSQNEVFIDLSTDGGSSWCRANQYGEIYSGNCGNFSKNNSLVYRALFSKNASGILGIDDVNISWENDATPPVANIITPTNSIYKNNITINVSANDSTGISQVIYQLRNSSGVNVTGWNSLFLTSGDTKNGYYSVSYDSNLLGEGLHTIYVNVSDYSFNYNDSASRSFNVDNEAPIISIINPVSYENISDYFLINASGTDLVGVINASFRISNSTDLLLDWTVMSLSYGDSNSGYWNASYDSKALSDGTYLISVNFTDSFNHSTTSELVNITVDNNYPVTVFVNPLSYENISGSFLLNISASDYVGVNSTEVRILNSSMQEVLPYFHLFLSSGNNNNGHWNASYDSVGKNGIHVLQVRTIDYLGNSFDQLFRNITFDNAGPLIEILEPSDNEYVSPVFVLNVTINDSTAVSVTEYQLRNATSNVSGWNTLSLGSGNTKNGKWNASINTGPYEDGNYTLRVLSNDSFNNKHNTTVNIRIDKISPKIVKIEPNNSLVKSSIEVNVTISDSAGVSFAEYLLENSTTNISGWNTLSLKTGTVTNGIWNASMITSSYPDGNYTITINSSDFGGQTIIESTNFTIDNGNPSISFVRPVFMENVSNNLLINTSVNDTGGVLQVEYRILTTEQVPVTSFTNMSLSSGNIYSGYWNATSSQSLNGVYLIQLRARDHIGNLNSSVFQNLSFDNSPPSINFIKPQEAYNLSGTFELNLTINDSTAVSVTEYQLRNATSNVSGWNTLSLGSGNTKNGKWNASIDSSSYDEGSFVLVVRSVDLINNTNNNSINISIDNTPPSINISSPSMDSGDSDGLVDFLFNISDNSLVNNCSLYINGELNQTKTSIENLSNSFTINNLAINNYLWNIKCYDNHGNLGNSNNVSFYVVYANNFGVDFGKLNITNINNLTLENVSYGKIIFNESLNVSGMNLNQLVDINKNYVSVDTFSDPRLNISANIQLFNLSYSFSPIALIDGSVCTDCDVKSYNSNNLSFDVGHFTNYTTTGNTELVVYDISDPEGGGIPIEVNYDAIFYANYTNLTSGTIINGTGVNCTIYFDDTSPILMSFNSTSSLYSHNRSFSEASIESYTVMCDGSVQGYETATGIDSIRVYQSSEAGSDFYIQRGTTTIGTSNSTATIFAGTDYDAPADLSKAFIRIVGTRLTGLGTDTGGDTQTVDVFMTSINNPENLLTNITFERGSADATYNTRIYWEVIEYVGRSGGANEIIVRDQDEVSNVGSTTVDGSASSAANDSDIVVFITGQRQDEVSSTATDRGLYTAEWLSGTDTPRFTRGDGTGTSYLSYAVVEFIGKNWHVQRETHTQSATGPQTETLSDEIENTSRAFLHVQVRTNSGNLDEQGVITWISANDTISFQRESEATGTQNVVAWVMENRLKYGNPAVVEHLSYSDPDEGSEPDTWTVPINEVRSLNSSSIMGESSHSNGGGTAAPRGSTGLNLSSTTLVHMWKSDSGQPEGYRFSVVQWPTELVNYGPNITLVAPPNNTHTKNVSISLYFNFTDDYLGTLNCTLYHNASGTWGPNETKNDLAQNTLHNFTLPFAENKIIWNVECLDIYEDASFATENNYLFIDYTNPVISNENATEISASSAIIVWDTDELANSTVEYGNTSSLGTVVSDATYVESRGIGLSGLDAGVIYYYNVTSCDKAGNCNSTGTFNFTTSLIPDTDPPIIENVSSVPSETTSFINWSTDESANSSVEYGETLALGNVEYSALLDKSHPITLTGLTPLTSYYFNVSSCDSSGNCNSSGVHNFTTIDITAPTITSLDYPDNNTEVKRGFVDFNFTASDNHLLNNCSLWHNVSGTWEINETINNPTKDVVNNITIYVPIGNFIWNVQCYDLADYSDVYNNNYSFYATDNNPEVVLNDPVDGAGLTNSTVNFNCTATDDLGLSTIELYTDVSGTWELTDTASVSGINITNIFSVEVPSKTITWNCKAIDNYGQTSFAPTNRSMFVENRNITVTEILTPAALSPLAQFNISGKVNLSNDTILEDVEVRIFINGTQYYRPGDGSDGSLTVSAPDTVLNNYTYLTQDALENNKEVHVGDTTEFSTGDSVLIIQMQRPGGTNAGAFEYLENITVINSSTINSSKNLSRTYYSGTFDQEAASASQIVRIPEYTNVTISSGSVVAPAWDGQTGGIVIFRSQEFINFSGGIINVSERGFRGGGCGICDDSDWGQNGEGVTGIGSGGGVGNPPTNFPNPDTGSNGGVGGYGPSGASGEPGGGGSYGTLGTIGQASTSNDANPGEVVGTTSLSQIIFGGGGGGGGDDDSTLPVAIGGEGAGAILIFSNKIINSEIYAVGEDGVTDSGAGGESGAGAGGTIWMVAQNMSFNNVNASGGKGQVDGVDVGGDGGDGRIRLDYQVFSGSTEPLSGYNGSPVTTTTDTNGEYFFDTWAPFIEGYYNVSVIAIVNVLLNGSASQTLIVDGTFPHSSIDSITPDPAERIVDDVTINWTASDSNLISYFANVTYPNGTLIGTYFDDFFLDASVLSVTGNYSVTVYGIDIISNENITNSTFEVIDTIAPIIENVTNGSVSDIAAVVQWDTDESSNSTVEYGNTTALGNTSSLATFLIFHSVALTSLTPNTLYYYNVTSCDISGNCNTSGGYNFTTSSVPDSSPPVITNVTAIPGEISANILWNTSEDSNSTVNYNISAFLGLSEEDSLFATEHSISLTGLTPLTLYYFNVSSCDLVGNCNSTITYNFTTIDITAPTISLLYPPNQTNSSLNQLEFNFSVTDNVPINLTNCTLYHNMSGTWLANETINNVQQSTVYNFTIPLLSNNVVWNVMCVDSQNNSGFAINNFTINIDNTLPTEFILISPANETVSPDLTPLFEWQQSNDTHFKNYTLELSEDIGFSYVNETFLITSSTMPSYQIVDELSTGILWYWRVIAYDTFNNSRAADSFTYLTDSYPVSSLNSPEGIIGSNGTIDFSCEGSDDWGVSNISLYTNRTGSWSYEDSIIASGMTQVANFKISGFVTGNYVWNCLVKDSNNQESFAGTNLSFFTDSRFVNLTASMQPTITGPSQNITINGSVILSDSTELPFEEIFIYLNGTRLNPNSSSSNFLIDKNPDPNWWDSSYQYRTLINITNNDGVNPLIRGTTMNISINTSALIAAGELLLNGSDLRMVYWNGSENFELDRINDSAFNTSNTRILFQLQDNISASAYDDSYFYYYDNSLASAPPEDENNIYSSMEVFMEPVDTNWETITLNRTYYNPIIISHITELDQPGEEAVTRIRNVESDSFQIRLQHPSGISLAERNVSIMVIEEGNYDMYGAMFEAHLVEDESNVIGSGTTTPTTYSDINFEQTYSVAPAVIAQVMSYKDSLWTTDHPLLITTVDFDLALEMGQYCDTVGACPNAEGHEPEDVGYFAIDITEGNLSGIEYDSGLTATNIAGRDNEPYCFFSNYSFTFDNNPLVFADLNLRAGSDGGWSGACNVSTTEIGLHTNEEDVSDGESGHAAESATYISFENAGEINLIKEIVAPTFNYGAEELSPARADAVGNFNFTFEAPALDGIYLVRITANYSSVVSGEKEFNLTVDSTPPSITLILPENNSFSNDITNNFTFYVEDLSPIINCSLFLNNQLNITETVIVTYQNNSFSTNNLDENIYYWNVSCYDYFGYQNQSNSRKITIDRTAPSINLYNPINEENFSTEYVMFNYSYIDYYSPNASCTININDSTTNNSVVFNNTPSNISLAPSFGYLSWNVSCVDIAGNINDSTNRNFTILGNLTDLRIRIQGNDSNVSWNSIAGALIYEVYSTNNYSQGFGSIANFTTSNTSILDENVSSERYYYVSAERGNIKLNSTRKAGLLDYKIFDLFNLVSNPFEYYPELWKNQNNDGFEFYGSDCFDSVWKYDSGSFLRTDWNGTHFNPAIGSETFTNAETNQSYWVTANGSCDITYTGFVRETNLTSDLVAGLNSASYNRIVNTTLPINSDPVVLFTEPENNIKAINRFNVSNQSFEVTVHYMVGGSPWGWFPSFNNKDFTKLERGTGYYFSAENLGNLTQVGP